MMFTLTEFAKLKSHFNDTLKILTDRDEKTEIEELTNPRRALELRFLKALFAELDKRINESARKPRSLRPFETIVYGAELIIDVDIERNLRTGEKIHRSQLHKRLNAGMGIDLSAKKEPSAKQYAGFFESLNTFFNLIYIDQNPRKGIAKEHALDDIPFSDLATLINISYEYYVKWSTNYFTNLKITGKSKSQPDNFKFQRDVPANIAAPTQKWSEFKQSFQDLVLKEFSSKKAAQISDLNEPRASQLGYLQALADALDQCTVHSSRDAEKIAILKGGMYIIKEQIGQNEYKKRPFSTSTISKSTVHTGLAHLINASETNIVDVGFLLATTNNFMHHMTIETAGSSEEIHEDAIKIDNIFSHLPKFNVAEHFAFTQHLIGICHETALGLGMKKIRDEVEGKKTPEKGPSTTTSLLNNWLFRTTPAKEAPETQDPSETPAPVL